MFGIRSGNPVDGTEGSYTVRDDKSGRPVETRVFICRIGRIAVSDPLRSSAIFELLNKLKIENHRRCVESRPFPVSATGNYRLSLSSFSLLLSREALKHTQSHGSMLSSYRSSQEGGRPLGGFLPLDFALDFLLQLGRQIGFENPPAEALRVLFDLVPPLRIGTTQQNQ